MRFRTKLMIIYTCFIIGLAILLGSWFHALNVQQYKNRKYADLELLAGQIVGQLEAMIKPMKFVSSYLLSDMDVLTGLRILGSIEGDTPQKERYREEAKLLIQSKVHTDYIMNNFYRVVIFNQVGDVIGNKITQDVVINPNVTLQDLTWLDQLKDHAGEPVLIGPHLDNWGILRRPNVFSIVKVVQGYNMGFIEVQMEVAELSHILDLNLSGIHIAVVLDDGTYLYHDETVFGENDLTVIQGLGPGTYEVENASGNVELLSINYSRETQSNILVKATMEAVQEERAYIVGFTLALSAAFVLVSLIFVVLSSGFLTKPIKKLTRLMATTEIEALDRIIDVETGHDELETMAITYQNMLHRLNAAIIKEKELSILQLKAQFDLLQTQVNPHFIYNVLNVISSKGVINQDESICDMCDSLGGMLRYATDTNSRTATIGEEMAYLEQYFYLLKARYDYKLTYQVRIEEGLKNVVVPKILFQQLVENSVKHGFENGEKVLAIDVYGYQRENQWFVRIKDNGSGFQPETLTALKIAMENMHQRIVRDQKPMEMAIGGMGILSVYARMLLLYQDSVVFEIYQTDDGVMIVLGGNLEMSKEG